MGGRSRRHKHLIAASAKAREVLDKKRQEKREEKMKNEIEQLKLELAAEKSRNLRLETELAQTKEFCVAVSTAALPEVLCFHKDKTESLKMNTLLARIIQFAQLFFTREMGITMPVWTILEKMTGMSTPSLMKIWNDYRNQEGNGAV